LNEQGGNVTSGERIQRGFRRLGALLGIPFIVLGAGLVIFSPETAALVARPNYFDRFDRAAPAPSGGLFDDIGQAPSATAIFPSMQMALAGVSLATGMLVFVAFLAIGWSVAGFAKD
jgi:hypothetical protein